MAQQITPPIPTLRQATPPQSSMGTGLTPEPVLDAVDTPAPWFETPMPPRVTPRPKEVHPISSDYDAKDIILTKKNDYGGLHITEHTYDESFTSRTYTNKTEYPFSIKSIQGLRHTYDIRHVLHNHLERLTFYFLKNDLNPFILVAGGFDETGYYYLDDRYDKTWKEYTDLKDEELLEDNLKFVNFFKNITKTFFKTTLRLSHTSFDYRGGKYTRLRYTVRLDQSYDFDYSRYLLKLKSGYSVSEILFEGRELQFNGEIRNSDKFWFYFWNLDSSTPLMIRTENYNFGKGENEKYIYYQAEEPGSNEWARMEIEKGEDYEKDGVLKIVLDSALYEYTNSPVKVKISKRGGTYSTVTNTKRFDGVPFDYICTYYLNFTKCTYKPKVGDAFTLGGVEINNELQKINAENELCSYITAYYPHGIESPVFICIGITGPDSDEEPTHTWYNVQKIGEKRWRQFAFEADPENDDDREQISNEIKNIYGKTISQSASAQKQTRHKREVRPIPEAGSTLEPKGGATTIFTIAGTVLILGCILGLIYGYKNYSKMLRGAHGWRQLK